jgi:hypothetical protein
MKHGLIHALRKVISRLACASLLVASTGAWAQPAATVTKPDPADVAALVQHENWPARLAMLRRATESQLEVAINSPAWAQLTREQKAALQADLQAFMAERFAWPGDLQDMVMTAYQEDASQQDIRTLLDFYGSADGQWLVQHFQAALDRVEQKLQLEARTLINTWSVQLSTAAAVEPFQPGPMSTWQPEGTHATQCATALTTLVKPTWSRQLVGVKLAAVERFGRVVRPMPDWEARSIAFQSRLRHEITYEAFEPMLVAALCAELSEADLDRGLALEQSPARLSLQPIEVRLGQGFGRRMQAWQQQTLMPGLGQRMNAARQAASAQAPAR